MKLIVVKRDTELLCLIYPLYSKLKPEQAIMFFEERFGIETSYREIGIRSGFTTSISPHYRFAIFATAALMYNLLLSYQELVISISQSPKEWNVTMLAIMDEFEKILMRYFKQAVEQSKMVDNNK
jgi:hypothetical protein